MTDPNRLAPRERSRTRRYAGLLLIVAGYLVFATVFWSAFARFGDERDFAAQARSQAGRALVAIVLIAAGGLLWAFSSRNIPADDST